MQGQKLIRMHVREPYITYRFVATLPRLQHEFDFVQAHQVIQTDHAIKKGGAELKQAAQVITQVMTSC